MGVITGASSLLTVAGGVASTVLSLGAGALSLGGKFVKSTVGKIALGAGTVAILCSDPKKGGFFGRAKELFGNMFKSVGSMIGTAVTGTTAKAAATVAQAGGSVNELAAAVSEADSPDAAAAAIKEAATLDVPDSVKGMCENAEMEASLG